MSAKKPNIILINCDDLGYGDLGCYGSSNNTPAIDKLAAEGMRLTSFYAASPLCSPSRGGMLTGCYPPRISFGEFDGKGVLFPGQGVGLSSDEETMGSLLKRAGYATKIIGKWHCGDQPEFFPTRRGFDSWFGLPYSNDMGRQDCDIDKKPWRANYPPLPLMEDDEVLQEQPNMASLTERYVEHSVRFIRQNKETPFFLYLAHMYVHLPLFAQERFLKETRNAYEACLATVDWSVDVIVNELERLGLRENTLIIFTSDNGSRGRADEGSNNAPLRGAKNSTWEGGIRVPCILSWPGTIKPGQVTDEILCSLDFMPTFAAISGTELCGKHEIDGLDASEFILNGGKSPRNEFVYFLQNRIEAIRKGPYKLHLYKNEAQTQQLYNLGSDIGETADISAQHPVVVAELTRLAEVYSITLGDSVRGIVGTGVRSAGRVENPKPLTQYDSSHPYIEAMYDSKDSG